MVDYSIKPHAFYFTFIAPPQNHFTRPTIDVARVQLIPWNQPQCEQHKQHISGNKAGMWHVEISDMFHDPDLGNIRNIIKYYNQKSIQRSSRAQLTLPTAQTLAENFRIPNIVTIQWGKPLKDQLAALRQKHDCVVIEGEERFYSLMIAPAGEAILTITCVQLIAPGHLKHQKQAPRVHEFYQTSTMARDSDHGAIGVTILTTDSQDIFRLTCQNFREPVYGEIHKVWDASAGEVALPSMDHVFDARPTRGQVFEQKRRLGLLHKGPDRIQ